MQSFQRMQKFSCWRFALLNIRAFRHMRELPNETALWNWLTRAARNAATDLHRTGGRYEGAMARFREWFGWGRAAESTEENSGDSDGLLEILDSVLAVLGREELALIEARYFEGMPLEEIGRRVGVSAKQSKADWRGCERKFASSSRMSCKKENNRMKPPHRKRIELLDDVLSAGDEGAIPSESGVLALVRREKLLRKRRPVSQAHSRLPSA